MKRFVIGMEANSEQCPVTFSAAVVLETNDAGVPEKIVNPVTKMVVPYSEEELARMHSTGAVSATAYRAEVEAQYLEDPLFVLRVRYDSALYDYIISTTKPTEPVVGTILGKMQMWVVYRSMDEMLRVTRPVVSQMRAFADRYIREARVLDPRGEVR